MTDANLSLFMHLDSPWFYYFLPLLFGISIVTEEDADRVWSCIENAVQIMVAQEEESDE